MRARVTATFNESLAPGTIDASRVQLRNATGTLISAAMTYDANVPMIVVAPTSPLAGSTTYTVTLKGGAGGLTDASGNAMGRGRGVGVHDGHGPGLGELPLQPVDH